VNDHTPFIVLDNIIIKNDKSKMSNSYESAISIKKFWPKPSTLTYAIYECT